MTYSSPPKSALLEYDSPIPSPKLYWRNVWIQGHHAQREVKQWWEAGVCVWGGRLGEWKEQVISDWEERNWTGGEENDG